jgi:hypothetical protein
MTEREPRVDARCVRAGRRLLCWAALTAVATGVAGASATARDPIVGTWEKTPSVKVDVTQTGAGSFVGKLLFGGTVGPCSYGPGLLKWEISKRADGRYVGTNHGFRWDSSDPKTCRDLPIVVTARLGPISRGRLFLNVCYEATDVTAAECNTWSRDATVGPDEVVPIASVSNGCGGAGWRPFVKVQNFLGNTSTFWNSRDNLLYDPRARPYTVDFSPACDLHDTGYAGAIVRDKLRGGIKDFRSWSRKQVDDKFLADMRLLCEREIEKSAVYALRNCRSSGGNVSVGALSRFNFVRCFGSAFYDADPWKPGRQATGPRANDKVGWTSAYCRFAK